MKVVSKKFKEICSVDGLEWKRGISVIKTGMLRMEIDRHMVQVRSMQGRVGQIRAKTTWHVKAHGAHSPLQAQSIGKWVAGCGV